MWFLVMLERILIPSTELRVAYATLATQLARRRREIPGKAEKLLGIAEKFLGNCSANLSLPFQTRVFRCFDYQPDRTIPNTQRESIGEFMTSPCQEMEFR